MKLRLVVAEDWRCCCANEAADGDDDVEEFHGVLIYALVVVCRGVGGCSGFTDCRKSCFEKSGGFSMQGQGQGRAIQWCVVCLCVCVSVLGRCVYLRFGASVSLVCVYTTFWKQVTV